MTATIEAGHVEAAKQIITRLTAGTAATSAEALTSFEREALELAGWEDWRYDDLWRDWDEYEPNVDDDEDDDTVHVLLADLDALIAGEIA